MAEKKQAKVKQDILKEALKLVPFEGWSQTTLEHASKKAGFDQKMGDMVFPAGVMDLVDFYLHSMDEDMVKEIKKLDLKQMKIRDKIKESIKIRLGIHSKNKLVVNKTMAFFALPLNAPCGMKLLWRTADVIWHEAGGDKSTDYNYYTKRFLLSGVYSSTLMYWLSDESKDCADTLDFLDRRIEDVMQVGKFMGKFKGK